MPLVMGVDSSTRSTKLEVRDADDGTLVASGQAPHPDARPPRSEQDPRSWWNALLSAITEAGVRDVAALSVAAQQHGMVALDAAGAVLRPAKLWNDIESTPDAARMIEHIGAQRWGRVCGSVPTAGSTISKLAWLARVEPRTFARIGTVLAPHDHLTYRLTGRFVTDRGDASASGYWSPTDDRWRPELLERAVGAHPSGSWSDKLPEVLGPSEPSDWLSASTHDVLGLRGRPLCGPGTGDTMAAALGVGLARADVVISLGASARLFSRSLRPTADGTGAIAGLADATGEFLPLVLRRNATVATDAIARVLGVDRDELDELALSAPTGARGVVLLPDASAQRTPARSSALGSLVGLHADVTREQIARAAFEGVVCSALDSLDALGAAGVDTSGRLVLIGAGARSRAYQRVVADLSGRDVLVPDGDEHIATGACVQAAAVLHGCAPDDVAAAWGLRSGEMIAPEPRVDRAGVRRAHALARHPGAEAPKNMKDHEE
ncbi:MAG: FGGY family carbohydrate kinase [Acidimicrobiales bacterium]